MTHKKYLAVCIAAASMGITSLQVVAEETVQNDKVTVVGKGGDVSIAPLDQEATVSKTGAPLEEIPFSIKVIDQDFMKDTGVKNIQDALLYTSGVYSGSFGFDTRGDFSAVRGVSPTMYLDGMRSIYGSYNTVRANTFALEQIEVLKGPSGTLYGQGSVGGIVNAVSKRPQEEEQGEIWAQLGSYDRKQLALDWTGALDPEGDFLFRIVTLARDSGTQVDYVDDDELLINPSILWKINEDTDLTLLASYQERKGGISAQFLPINGTLSPGASGQLPTSTFAGEPDWDKYDRQQSSLTAELNHRLNEQLSWTTVARYLSAETETNEFYPETPSVNIPGLTPVTPYDPATGLAYRHVITDKRSTQGITIDSRLNAKFKVKNSEHNVVFGVDHQNITTRTWDRKAGAYISPINLHNPVYAGAPTAATFNRPDPADIAIDTEQLGAYLADHINVGSAVFSLGIRHDETSSRNTSTEKSTSKFTKHAGAMYNFSSGISPYISYAESFEPTLSTDASGNLFDPIEGDQIETGVKYLSPDKTTSISVSYYQIDEENRTMPSPTNPLSNIQAAAEIDGWELEMWKKWGKLTLLFNYTDLDATYLDGTRLPYLAEKQASIWGTYQADNNWRFGLGARYVGDNISSDLSESLAPFGVDGSSVTVPSVTLVDAMIGYETGDWEFTADVKNLTNKTYVSWCRASVADCGYGEKLNATLNARYKF